MLAELFIVSVTFLGLVTIDKFSSAVGVILCVVITYLVTTLWFQAENVDKGNEVSKNSFFESKYYRILCFFSTKAKELYDCIYQYICASDSQLFLDVLESSNSKISSNICHCGVSPLLNEEIKTIVNHILREYIQSWYGKISDSKEFIQEINYVVEDTIVALCNGISRIDINTISYKTIDIYSQYFSHFLETLHKVKSDFKKNTTEECLKLQEQILQNFQMKHWATKDPVTEWCYLKSLVGTLLDSFGPIELLSCPLLHNVVVEILTQNVMYSLINLLTDPNYLNSLLLRIFQSHSVSDSGKLTYYFTNTPRSETIDSNYIANNSDEICKQNFGCNLQVNAYEEPNYTSFNSISSQSENTSAPDRFLDADNKPHNSVPSCSISEDRSGNSGLLENTKPDDNMCKNFVVHNASINTALENNTDKLASYPMVKNKAHSNINLSENEFMDVVENKKDNERTFLEVPNIKRSRSVDFISNLTQFTGLLPLNTRNQSIRIQGRNNKTYIKFKSDFGHSSDIEQAEEATETEVPHLFTNIEIIGTEQQLEANQSPYTLYCIQYNAIFHDIISSSEVPELVTQEISIKRRFREFVALQSRLEDNPELRSCLKGIKGPSKWLASPFSPLDKKNIAARKIFLEDYLRQLCKQNAIMNSAELQEFLAYGGDASIAFVKKATDLTVPRIDKMIFKGMRGAIDLIKTALPNLPAEANTSKETFHTKKCDIDLPHHEYDANNESKFQEHHIEYAKNESELMERIVHHINNFDLNSSLESVYEQDWNPLKADDVRNKNVNEASFQEVQAIKHSEMKYWEDEDACNKNSHFNEEENVPNPTIHEEENTLGSVIIGLLIEALQISSSFSAIIHLISPFKFILGTYLNSIIEKKLAEMSQPEKFVYLLHMFHMTLWPEEKLGQRTPNRNLNSANLTNEAIKKCIGDIKMLRSFEGPLCIPEMIDLLHGSIQHQQLNRCVLFYLFDMLIHLLCSKEE